MRLLIVAAILIAASMAAVLASAVLHAPDPPGTITRIIDGDTIAVGERTIRFALASAPELGEVGGEEAKAFIERLCPVGSPVVIDEDAGQPGGSYGRVLAVVHCNGTNLNAALLDSGVGYLAARFCGVSEFAESDWAQRHGC